MMQNIEEIRKNAPSGATHYVKSSIDLGGSNITYFKFKNGKYYEYFSYKFARYETGVETTLIKPL